tara:strand:- start:26 stop:193 length:168 start_codon:yes stop_codon:yes gene_type:complete
MEALKSIAKVIWKALITLLPAGWKKQLIVVLCEWAVKSTKTKLDDKLWAKIKDKL